ncbi:Aste57867_20401 [Aphanomyces stellatus]|uniref:Aste57867_20401 protein n=1 Tax=Aphanomyces stellatus TaxID=120398 RepID=A0A485LEW2_9STRA|nr:hypothetical protein As57867_020335 [Aphanomyces stellatus]VFT97087.1 Aste57867_20401 [Aphanomyces stellatus]
MAASIARLPLLELRVDFTKGRGIHVAAADGIPAGTTLFTEVPFGSVVLSHATSKLCAACFREADPDICCDDCSQVMFCSDACQRHLADVHALECSTLEDLDLIAKKSQADRDLLALLTRILCTRVVPPSPSSTTALVSSYDDVLAMAHATHQLPASWLTSVRVGADLLLKSLPSTCAISVDDVVGLAARVNENSYSLEAYAASTSLGVASVGLFPVAGLVNHSCRPNCAWSNTGRIGAMAVRTTEFLPHGAEVCLTYIDAKQPRVARQHLLHATKHFDCRCDRCVAPLATSVDALVDGVCCGTCRCLIEHDEASQRWGCPSCGLGIDEASVNAPKAAANATYKQAQAKYDQRLFKDAHRLLLQLHTDHQSHQPRVVLHPSHAILTAAARVLADCCVKLSDHAAAYSYHREALARLVAIAQPSATAAVATAHLDVAQAIAVGLKHNLWPDERGLKQREWKEQLEACRVIRKLCYEEDHPLVQQVDGLLQRSL